MLGGVKAEIYSEGRYKQRIFKGMVLGDDNGSIMIRGIMIIMDDDGEHVKSEENVYVVRNWDYIRVVTRSE